jgi:hypothetical protein
MSIFCLRLVYLTKVQLILKETPVIYCLDFQQYYCVGEIAAVPGALWRKRTLFHIASEAGEAQNTGSSVIFEFFTAVTMKNGVVWDVTP